MFSSSSPYLLDIMDTIQNTIKPSLGSTLPQIFPVGNNINVTYDIYISKKLLKLRNYKRHVASNLLLSEDAHNLSHPLTMDVKLFTQLCWEFQIPCILSSTHEKVIADIFLAFSELHFSSKDSVLNMSIIDLALLASWLSFSFSTSSSLSQLPSSQMHNCCSFFSSSAVSQSDNLVSGLLTILNERGNNDSNLLIFAVSSLVFLLETHPLCKSVLTDSNVIQILRLILSKTMYPSATSVLIHQEWEVALGRNAFRRLLSISSINSESLQSELLVFVHKWLVRLREATLGIGSGFETPGKMTATKDNKLSVPVLRTAIELIYDIFDILPHISSSIFDIFSKIEKEADENLNNGESFNNPISFLTAYIISSDPRTSTISTRFMQKLLSCNAITDHNRIVSLQGVNEILSVYTLPHIKKLCDQIHFDSIYEHLSSSSSSKNIASSRQPLLDLTNQGRNEVIDKVDLENNHIYKFIAFEPVIIELNALCCECVSIIHNDCSRNIINEASNVLNDCPNILLQNLQFLCIALTMSNKDTSTSSFHDNVHEKQPELTSSKEVIDVILVDAIRKNLISLCILREIIGSQSNHIMRSIYNLQTKHFLFNKIVNVDGNLKLTQFLAEIDCVCVSSKNGTPFSVDCGKFRGVRSRHPDMQSPSETYSNLTPNIAHRSKFSRIEEEHSLQTCVNLQSSDEEIFSNNDVQDNCEKNYNLEYSLSENAKFADDSIRGENKTNLNIKMGDFYDHESLQKDIKCAIEERESMHEENIKLAIKLEEMIAVDRGRQSRLDLYHKENAELRAALVVSKAQVMNLESCKCELEVSIESKSALIRDSWEKLATMGQLLKSSQLDLKTAQNMIDLLQEEALSAATALSTKDQELVETRALASSYLTTMRAQQEKIRNVNTEFRLTQDKCRALERESSAWVEKISLIKINLNSETLQKNKAEAKVVILEKEVESVKLDLEETKDEGKRLLEELQTSQIESNFMRDDIKNLNTELNNVKENLKKHLDLISFINKLSAEGDSLVGMREAKDKARRLSVDNK